MEIKGVNWERNVHRNREDLRVRVGERERERERDLIIPAAEAQVARVGAA